MANLRVNKIAAPIVKDEFTGSVYFDGVNDGLIIQDNDDFNFGSGDFCMEMFIYPKSYSPSGYSYFMGQYGTSYTTFWSMASEKNDCFFYYGGSNIRISGTYTIPLNAWTHVAVTKEGNTIRLFTNGSLDASGTFTHTLNDASVNFTIGKDSADAYDFDGYVSNARVCKGHAVYTENFTVPTRELPVHTAPPKGVVFPAADNRTVLLACQSSTDATAEATGRHIITVDGDATAADANPGLIRKTNITSTITENTGSVFFDGTGDYIKSSIDSEDFAFSGDFAMECWVQKAGNGAHADSIGNVIMMTGNASNNRNGLWISVTNAGSLVAKVAYDTSSWALEISGGTLSNDVWYHVALTRSGSTVRLFLDGVQQASGSNSTDITTTYSNAFSVGGQFNPAGSRHVNGYVSNARICKGHPVYTSNFAPPTTELEVHEGPDDDRTVLLACYDGENIFADKSGRHIIAAYGDRLSSPTPTATDSPIGITTHNPGLTRNVDATAGPTFQGGAGFVSQNWLTLPKGTTTDRNRTGGRGLFGGGQTPGRTNIIEFVTISSMGNAQDFGDLTDSRLQLGSCGSSTRGLFAGGEAAAKTNIIDYVTIASTGNAVDFGDLIEPLEKLRNGLSNNTRGIFGGGGAPGGNSNIINYVTISTLGDALDFGDLLRGKTDMAAASSPVRGLFFNTATAIANTEISYITIASTGNALDFGDLTTARSRAAASSSSTRALIFGGSIPGNYTNSIEYVTIPTLGNASDFGDLNEVASEKAGTSNSIRGIVIGGDTSGGNLNRIDYVTIQTTGNTKDFGDISSGTDEGAACSDSHGGIS